MIVKILDKLENLLHIPKNKLLKIILIIGFLAIAGILLSESLSDKDKSRETANQTRQQTETAYEKETEQKLTNILSQIEGIGKVKVMISLESGEQSIYSFDKESSSADNKGSYSEKKKYLIVDNNGESPVLEKQIQPTIRGVIVVCEGADNIEVREAVTECIHAGLGVSLSNISVVRGGKNG